MVPDRRPPHIPLMRGLWESCSMPELPEVQTVVTSLRPRVTGATVAGVRMNRTDIVSPGGVDLAPLLTGRTIASVERRAKRIVFTLDGGQRFYVHLGMTGQLTVERVGAPVRPHTHMVLELRHGGTKARRQEGWELRCWDP